MPLTSPIRYLAPFVLLLSACGGGGGGGSGSPPDGGGTPDPADETPVQILSRINCNAAAEGPVAGPLDQAQAALIAQTAENLGSNAQIGASGEAFVVAVSRLLDLVDALAASGSTLAAEQDPEAAAADLAGAGDAVQCALVALADAAQASPLAQVPGVDMLLEQLADLALSFDPQDPSFVGTEGLEALTAQLAGLGTTLSDMIATAAANPQYGVPEELQALVMVPAVLLDDIAAALISVGQLDGQASADNLSAAITGVLGGIASLAPGDAAAAPLAQAEAAISEGLAQLLVPLFDAISGQFAAGGMPASSFSDFIAGGFTGADTGFLQGIIAGGAASPDGADRPSLETLLSGIPVLGDVLAQVLGGGGFDTGGLEGAPLIAELLAGGESGLPSLLEALQLAAAQLEGAAGSGDVAFPTDAAGLATLLESLAGDNALASALEQLFAALTGGGGGLAALLAPLLGILGA